MGDEDRDQSVLDALSQLATDLGHVLRPRGDREFLQAIVDIARLAFDAAACSIALLNDEEDQLEFQVASGAGAEAIVGIRIPADRGVAGWAVMSGQAIAIADVRQDPRFAADVAESTGYVPGTIMAMPVESDRQTFGVIEVLDRRESGGEGADDMELLAMFAQLTTLAVETSRIFSSLGQELFEAAAVIARRRDLHDALELQATRSRGARSDLAELALLFHDLGELGADERQAATRITADFVAYARTRRR